MKSGSTNVQSHQSLKHVRPDLDDHSNISTSKMFIKTKTYKLITVNFIVQSYPPVNKIFASIIMQLIVSS